MDILFSLVRAFLVGGCICLVGQILLNKTTMPPAKILVSFVVAGVFLGFVGIYEHIVKIGGAGATVPLTGFGFLLSEGVKKAVLKEGLIGIFKGGLEAASVGISYTIFMAFMVALIFKSKGDRI